ncbi:amidase [soil metagenome]
MRPSATILPCLLLLAATEARAAPRVEEASIDQLDAMMTSGAASSSTITSAYLARIAAMDRKGPTLRTIIALNPDALTQAKAADARRRAGRALGPLDGIPILIKDNIETADPMPTTAGSLALRDNLTRRDAPVVALLRRAGAVILGKTNLSEWANIRSDDSMSGWSAVGGQVKNPYALDRSPCGSSSGSGAATAASFAAAALGTETNGSVVCPSAINGLVGLKPTVGLVSRTHVVPISHTQDTPGPMARSVRDVAILFSAMVASDPADPVTKDADSHRNDYAASLGIASLKGVRVAVLRPKMRDELAARLDAAVGILKEQGAVVTEVRRPKLEGLSEAEHSILMTELKADLAAYLATTPPAVRMRTLADLIAFNEAHIAKEMPFFGQDSFEESQKTPGLNDPAYLDARAKAIRLAGAEGLEVMLKAAGADILVQPTQGPAWLIDPIHGDQGGGPSASGLPAIAGYPHLTVPMGLVKGMPVGLSFIGRPYSEHLLLGAGYVYEQASHARTPPRYLPQADVGPGLEGSR